jgi:hypothetical protein
MQQKINLPILVSIQIERPTTLSSLPTKIVKGQLVLSHRTGAGLNAAGAHPPTSHGRNSRNRCATVRQLQTIGSVLHYDAW